MIDFTNCPVNRFRAYGGANGNKINITWGELYSAINSNQWSNAITQEQADYLRAKYL